MRANTIDALTRNKQPSIRKSVSVMKKLSITREAKIDEQFNFDRFEGISGTA